MSNSTVNKGTIHNQGCLGQGSSISSFNPSITVNSDTKNILEEIFCKVEECSRSSNHVTSYHYCDNCKGFGHGMKDCKRQQQIMNLEKYRFDILPEKLWCVSKNCSNYWTHTTIDHICDICNELHVYEKCQNHPLSKIIDHERFNIMPEKDWCTSKNCYDYWTHDTSNHVCDACQEFHVYEKCPCHPLIKLYNDKKFLENNNVYRVKCPTCRVQSFCLDTEIKVYGIKQECLICCTNYVDVSLPMCRHAEFCKECIDKIKTDIIQPIDAHDPNLIKNLKIYGLQKLRLFKGFCYIEVKLSNNKVAIIKQKSANDEPNVMIFNPYERNQMTKFINQ